MNASGKLAITNDDITNLQLFLPDGSATVDLATLSMMQARLQVYIALAKRLSLGSGPLPHAMTNS